MHLNRKFRGQHRQSFALIATLALLAVATILLVLFVSTTTLDRSASYTYSQSVKADQIGLGGLHLVVSQLQAEMYKDALPDTGPLGTNATLFTNVTAYNILPQANATNASLPSLVKMSTNTLFFSGGTNASTSYRNGVLMATTISSTTPSLNGRSVSTNVWNQIYLGQYPSSTTAPYWIIMTRGGATSASSPSLTTLKDPTIGNTGYAVGRIAFAVYDEGGLLDVNAAGYPSTISPGTALMNTIKGTLAGADLSQIPGITPSTFIAWRNSASSASANTYLSYVTNFAATNGFGQVYPGDSSFISRQDLIRAAQTGGEGLTTAALPYLATFTRELNAPSWRPTLNGTAATKYNYANNALNTNGAPFTTTVGVNLQGGGNPNPYAPYVRYWNSGTVTSYKNDGTTYPYTVNKGDSVVHRRFPLDRLLWITPKGPSALLATNDPFYNPGGTVAAIQSCFGLYWAAAEVKNATLPSDTANWTGIKLWKYVGSTAAFPTAENAFVTGSPIENLLDVAKESPPREPNFFELLQAGVLSGSLGINFGAPQSNFQFMANQAQLWPAYQLLRIGANIITQAQSSAYPINIEYNNNGYSFVASGVANLPYLNALKFAEGVDGATTSMSPSSLTPMATYGLVGLWNPHQQTSAGVPRPNVRVYVQGAVSLASGWATNYPNIPTLGTNTYGVTFPMSASTYYAQLVNSAGSATGVNGFLNPFAITSSDVDPANTSPVYSANATGWTANTSAITYQSTAATYPDSGVTYEALRFPNVNLALQESGTNVPGYFPANSGATTEGTSFGYVHFSTVLGDQRTTAGATPTAAMTATNMFQIIMKYQDPNDATGATYVPYCYWSGNNSVATWWGQFTMAGPTISPAYTTVHVFNGMTNYPTVTGPTYSPMPTVDQTMHSTLVNGTLRYHSGLMMNPDPRVTLISIFPMSGDDPTASTGINGTIANPMIDSIWSGSANTTAPFNICGYGGGGSGSPATAPAVPSELNTVPTNFKNWFLPAYLTRNNTSATFPNSPGTSTGNYFTAYSDTDGIQRIADSGLFTTPATVAAPPTSGNPYYDPNDTPTITGGQRTGDRPVILNRPFASVGELGYVCRDDPWRSLDFFSAFGATPVSTSADSGLLDLFTVTDSVANAVVAGRVNLNTKNATVLQAILSGTMADPAGNTMATPSTITAPAALATALTNYTSGTTSGTGPLVNKDQLATKFSPALPIGSATTSTIATTAPFGNSDEQNVKAFREAYIRSLADVGQTRTWNLLIDLVAQAGKYPSSAADLTQFEVEGERHYWLHVAIDRFTGKVIDRQLELIGP